MDEAAFLFFVFRKYFFGNMAETRILMIILNEAAFFVSIYFLLFLTVFNKKTLSLFYN